MSDDLVKRLVAGSESLNMPPSVQSIKSIRCMDAMDEAARALVAKDAEIARLRGALEELSEWAAAYPVAVFPEPDFLVADKALQAVGLSVDAVSASNFRHVLNRVKKITSAALDTQHNGETP